MFDPFETGEEGVLEYEMITAKDLLAMFDGLAQVESVFTRGQDVMVVARLEEIPLTTRPTWNEMCAEGEWESKVFIRDTRNQRIALRMRSLRSISSNDLALCTEGHIGRRDSQRRALYAFGGQNPTSTWCSFTRKVLRTCIVVPSARRCEFGAAAGRSTRVRRA
jgi:hypothetical protein